MTKKKGHYKKLQKEVTLSKRTQHSAGCFPNLSSGWTECNYLIQNRQPFRNKIFTVTFFVKLACENSSSKNH